MIDLKKKSECCGCTACYNVCPKNAIYMEEDEEGFLYPKIDRNKCIDCGLCEKVCPVRCSKEEKREQVGYILNNADEDVRRKSNSGGFFTPLAEYVIQNGGVVFGATLDKNFKVVHEYTDKKEEIVKFLGSKYVQSELRATFSKAKEFLDKGRLVCFSGLPCQIEGLLRYLRKDYENLITVDLMCHSVPSPLVYRKYLKYIKETKLNNEKIESVRFRDKSKYGYQYSLFSIKSKNKSYSEGSETDPFLRAFLHGYSERPSCYDCKFKKRYHVSDFTIWDCYNPSKFAESLDDNKGTSRLLINSSKGVEIFKHISDKFDLKQIDVDFLTENVHEMVNSAKPNDKREDFFRDLNNLDEKVVFKKYFPNTIKARAERFARRGAIKLGIYKNLKVKLKKILKKN